jgi:radical SAM superfamily enzyme YgiQ (UPF0313 family)
VSLDVTDDPSLIREMALAGCTGVFVGFESLTDDNLTDARKKTPRAGEYARRVRAFHDAGIQVNGSFVLGFDHDRPDCFGRLVDWIESVRMESATYHILTPYPGTPLFRQMHAQGRLLHTDWSRYDTAHVVFRPRHMTPDELAAGYAHCYDRTFSPGGIWRRRPRDWRAVPAYLAMAVLYKKMTRTTVTFPLLRRAYTPPTVGVIGASDSIAAVYQGPDRGSMGRPPGSPTVTRIEPQTSWVGLAGDRNVTLGCDAGIGRTRAKSEVRFACELARWTVVG